MSKSWSGLRKELEQDFICDSLKGRVQYFITHYHKAPDQYGRVAVRVDGQEIVRGNPYTYVKNYYKLIKQYKDVLDVPRRLWSDGALHNDEVNLAVEDMVEEKAKHEGIFEIYHFTDAIRIYKNNPIMESIQSENPLVRMLAVMDRRIGKRTLYKIKEDIYKQPEWLQFFYELRIEAEGLS